VIVVASPKGGCGKTTVASNLGVGLALAAPQSTVLVDLDVQFGDVASALQLHPERCLTDAVSGPASQDTMVLKTFLTPHPTGLHVLCGSDLPAAGDRISTEMVRALLKQLAAEFPYVVVDTSAGMSEHTLAALDCATDAVLVCGMDVPSARGMRKELLLLNDLNLAPRRHVVLNFAERRGGLTVRDVQNAIGSPASVVLPRSRAVQVSTDQGVPLLQSGARDVATKELRRLVAMFAPTPRAPERRRAAMEADVLKQRVPQHRAPSAVPR
jgi:pilus assembly protein CpaE